MTTETATTFTTTNSPVPPPAQEDTPYESQEATQPNGRAAQMEPSIRFALLKGERLPDGITVLRGQLSNEVDNLGEVRPDRKDLALVLVKFSKPKFDRFGNPVTKDGQPVQQEFFNVYHRRNTEMSDDLKKQDVNKEHPDWVAVLVKYPGKNNTSFLAGQYISYRTRLNVYQIRSSDDYGPGGEQYLATLRASQPMRSPQQAKANGAAEPPPF